MLSFLYNIAPFHPGNRKISSDKRAQCCFENYNLTPLDMYNGLSQVYRIKPEGRIH